MTPEQLLHLRAASCETFVCNANGVCATCGVGMTHHKNMARPAPMSQDTPRTPAPTYCAGCHQDVSKRDCGCPSGTYQRTPTPAPTFTERDLVSLANGYRMAGMHGMADVCQFAASLVRREELLVAALETIRSEAAFGLSFGAGNDVGNKDAALRSIYRITTAPAKPPTEAP